jgi:hypothetical protein
MTNSENLGKSTSISRGIVVFAFNTATVDYVRIADCTSQLASRYMNLPVTLITDHAADPKFRYDNIVTIDSQGNNFRDGAVQWRNFGRHYAYSLSPYDETVLLDADYLVLNNSINTLFETDFDYRLIHHNTNYAGVVYEKMGETSLPFVWATVVVFRKSKKSELLFDLVGKIERNYNYYRALYNIREGNYRNDYAFAIANNILNGYNLNENQGIPWRMFTIEERIDQVLYDDNFLYVYSKETGRAVPRQNTHIMDKQYLQSPDFEQLVEALIESA